MMTNLFIGLFVGLIFGGLIGCFGTAVVALKYEVHRLNKELNAKNRGIL